ncbi:SDR family NAD(P)-dependent oxidoreductase [Fructobacillus sp. M2-14]|uniref:SDR family NAD(P)-dependent oxidoreductase n=1 Tax=Fructobacillus broussonetiae TaxID=2713173 RepID=A0ABS5QY85_9LACO|nr:SDR family NAD(P)-dependent oxidoreductase [Fructobacillus broussonetiae]MBS9338164.1 SDR family NAD(P)-dependent oxidoreductase [Fructobacillus broussonetiae]
MAKRVLITGATDGIGKITAQNLAKMGQEVIVHGRNAEKAKAVVSEIKEATGNQNVDYLIADLMDLSALDGLVSNSTRNTITWTRSLTTQEPFSAIQS